MLKVEIKNGKFVGVRSDDLVKCFTENKILSNGWLVQIKEQDDGKKFIQSTSFCDKDDGVHSVCSHIYEDGNIRVYLKTPQGSIIRNKAQLSPLKKLNGTLIHTGDDIDTRYVYFKKVPKPVILREATFMANVACFKKNFPDGGKALQEYIRKRFSVGIKWQRIPETPVRAEYTIEDGENIRIDVFDKKTGDWIGSGNMKYKLI